MRAHKVTNADLGALLIRLGMVRRSIHVDHSPSGGDNGATPVASTLGPDRRLVPAYAYSHAETGALLLLPLRPPDENVASHYLHAARRTLVDWGIATAEEFDRWLCKLRFPDDHPAVASVRVGQARTTS